MGTAKQLIPTFVDAQPLYWDRSYAKNMRPIRGYPDWWRIIDTEAFIDGPVTQGGNYVDDLYIWKAEVLRDDDYEFTSTIELSNLRERLTSDSSVVNGQTVYEFQYLFSEPDVTYTHTDVVDAVSLEFDQLGREMIAFEANSNLYFSWYDTTVPGRVVENYGEGFNPQVITNTYRRTGSIGDSEILLFYVDNATKQIVYRKQLDRFGVTYTLPEAPSDVIELLKVSKNLYGGITVLYCYDDGSGGLLTGSTTARSNVDELHIGTDDNIKDKSSTTPLSGSLLSFTIKLGSVLVSAYEESSSAPTTGQIINFTLRPAQVTMEDLAGASPSDSYETVAVPTVGSILSFDIKNVNIVLADEVGAIPTDRNTTILLPTAGSILSINLRIDAVVTLTNDQTANEQRIASATVGDITNFTLG